jgi:malate dehydrogenase (oxaloacetate-decarboxylating)
MDYAAASLAEHRRLKGKIGMVAKASVTSKDDLATFYSPGVGAVSSAIAENPELAWDLTWRGNTVAVVSDGSAVLGLGNIGPLAAQPVMAGKALLFKEFAGIDAIPLVLDTQDTDQIIQTVKLLAPSFGGINLEDISAPRCFAIEAALQDLGIPVMHDDQHGTAVVVVAGLINAMKALNLTLSEVKIVVNGAGAGGTAVTEMILTTAPGVDITAVDSKGIIGPKRTDLNPEKQALLAHTNPRGLDGDLKTALTGAHVFIGLSKAGALPAELIAEMAPNPVIFALANPIPEIMPDEAIAAGAAIVATGRSDFPNQVNNVLAFPGIFRGALDSYATKITPGMLSAASHALAGAVTSPSRETILPNPLDKSIVPLVAAAVAAAARAEGCIRSK